MTMLPFGLVAGFSMTSLPFLLTKIGVSVDHVASVSALVMSPTFWAFLVTPIVDVGLTRRTWAFLTALVAACCVGSAVWVISPSRLPIFSGLLLLGMLAIVLYGSALGGWQASFLPDSMRGKVAGWANAANLGGGALGAMIFLELAEKLSFKVVGVVFAGLCFLPALLLFALPVPAKPELETREVFTQSWRKAWEACRRRECLIGFVLFLSPTACVAATNLFSGLGKDFQTGSQQVIWVTGAGCSIASAIGSVAGGFLADRINRGVLYILGGIGASVFALCMAFSPHSAPSFTYGVLAYNLAAGVCYAAFSALGFQLVGKDNPVASTVLGLFAAASNGAIVYMTWLDGVGYRFFSARGLLCVDAGMSLLAAVPLFWLVRSGLRRVESSAPGAEKPVPLDGSVIPSV